MITILHLKPEGCNRISLYLHTVTSILSHVFLFIPCICPLFQVDMVF